MEFVDYDVLSLTVDGEEIPTRNWTRLGVPASPAAGSLVVPTSVCNNPRVVILSVDGESWETEDNGIRTMEYCFDENDRAMTDLSMAVLGGHVYFHQEGEDALLRNGDYELRLRKSGPELTEI